MADARVWDVLVIGAGPAGAVAAAALAERGLRVAILEKDLRPEAKPGEVLTPNAIPILSHLGLLDIIDTNENLASPLACIDRAWSAQPNREHFLDHPGGRAWVVDRGALESVLMDRAKYAGVDAFFGHHVRGLIRRHGYWSVQARSNDGPITLRAAFVVDASGRAATVARRLGAKRERLYRLLALHVQSAQADTEGRSEPASLSIEAAAIGWWYAVCGPRQTLTCALFTDDPDRARGDAARSALLAALDDTISLPCWTKGLIRSGRVRIVDASPSFLDHPAGEDWLAIGDAATSFDPIASQGLANALASAVGGAEAIGRQLEGDRVAMQAFVVRATETWRHSVRQLFPIYQAAAHRWPTPFWQAHLSAWADESPAEDVTARYLRNCVNSSPAASTE